jgi:hypothetical protein
MNDGSIVPRLILAGLQEMGYRSQRFVTKPESIQNIR